VNLFGLTEAGSLIHVIQSPSEADSQSNSVETSIPIGRPISNCQVYVLDEKMRPVPVGCVGELFVGELDQLCFW
jgi:non-ribosomal peptide synthetase component F